MDNPTLIGEPLHEEVMPGGCHWSFRIGRGRTLRLVDLEGGANVGMLFYNPHDLLERYNAPDTLKCQHTFRLMRGHCLYSDMGRIFCSITADGFGGHDTVCGTLTPEGLRRRFGERTFAEARNERTQSGLDAFLVELAKYGLSRRDLAANVNWFSRVAVDEEGNLALDSRAARPGAVVDLRFEMETLVMLHTCPHPLHPPGEYPRKPVRLAFYATRPVAEGDPCLESCPENRRGFANTRLYAELCA